MYSASFYLFIAVFSAVMATLFERAVAQVAKCIHHIAE